MPVKKPRGRPRLDTDRVEVRLPRDHIARIDALRARINPSPSRPEMIRQIVAAALLANETFGRGRGAAVRNPRGGLLSER